MCTDTFNPHPNRSVSWPAVARLARGHAAQSAGVVKGSAVHGWRRRSA